MEEADTPGTPQCQSERKMCMHACACAKECNVHVHLRVTVAGRKWICFHLELAQFN